MTIHEIKENLNLATVLDHYGLKPNKNNMLLCPFHDDKTASLQVKPDHNKYKCYACDKKGDVIQFVQDYEKLSKHEALKKCTELVEDQTSKIESPKPIKMESLNQQPPTNAQFLEKMFLSFRKGLLCSEPAKEYCGSRNLDFDKLEIGFNGGQFHHGTRKDETLINNCLGVGLLIDKNLTSRTGEKAYQVFGNKSIVFPLKNKGNQTVSFYFRSILNVENAKHFYLKNRTGLYPNYPNPNTKKLILTESIIDAASLLQIEKINKSYGILACYGTNGLNEEIQKAISELKDLDEIIFAFDNDKAGNEAEEKYAELFINIKTTTLELPNKDINETLQLHESEIMTDLLEKRKSILFSDENFSIEDQTENKPPADNDPITFLKTKDLLKRLGIKIGESGIVGEENSRLLLFLIVISYLNKSPIHAIVQGSSGSGKTFLISNIADLMPQEDVLKFTRITESALYNYGEFDLYKKILIIEDLDGLKEDALYALRELISNQSLTSLVSIKDKKGNNNSKPRSVKGQFSSLSATTKGELYEDNMNRSFVLAVDESAAQTQRIIDYQNQKITGEIDENAQQKTVKFIQQIVRSLKPYEVQNPYATQLQLPDNVRNKRRLNEMIQAVIKQITILNQYQRKQTKDGKLVTEIEDIENGIEILFESIILKIDELDGSLRQFFEKLKKGFKDQDFNRFDAMEKTGFKKTQLQFYLNELVRLEYLKQSGFHNKGFKYKVSHLDNNQQVRIELKAHFNKQLEDLKRTLANASEH
jgi:DNA primase